MLKRCYSESFHLRYPTYKGCETTAEWLTSSNFREWMLAQDWEGMQLDKDLLRPGNKLYSPETCRFIPGWLNNLFTDRGRGRGDFPLGVSKHQNGFQMAIRIDGSLFRKQYKTISEASRAYVDAKTNYVRGKYHLLTPELVEGCGSRLKLLAAGEANRWVQFPLSG